MKPFIEQAKFYATYHQEALSRRLHLASVPLVILSLMILLGFVHVVIPGLLDVNLAELAALALIIYYFRLQWRLALILTPIFIILLWIAEFFSYSGPSSFSLWSFIIILFIGIALQAVGHFREGKRPAFVDSAWQALIAPLFLTAEVFFIAGRMQELKEAIYGKTPEKAKHEKKEK